MKIGINHGAYRGLTLDEYVRFAKEAGAEYTFCGTEGNCDEIIRAYRAAGIEVINLHAPFNGPININEMWKEGDLGEAMLGRLTHAVDVCAGSGIRRLVVHLSSGDNCPFICDLGLSRFDRLMEYADRNGVTVCYENQRKIWNLTMMIERYPQSEFCWDVGHEACFMDGKQMMPLLGDRLGALHVHDNRGVHDEDLHMIPGDSLIDFERVARQIAASPFDDVMMLEIITGNSRGFYDNVAPRDYYLKAGEAARKLASRIEEIRTGVPSDR